MKCNANILARIVHWTTRFAVSWAIYVTCIIGFMLIFGELFLTIYSNYLELQRNGVITTPKHRIFFFTCFWGPSLPWWRNRTDLSHLRDEKHTQKSCLLLFLNVQLFVLFILRQAGTLELLTHLMPTKASDAIFPPNLSKVTNLSSHNEHVLSVWRRYATGTKGKR